MEQIQFLLGHVSVQTTEHYLDCKQRIRSPQTVGSAPGFKVFGVTYALQGRGLAPDSGGSAYLLLSVSSESASLAEPSSWFPAPALINPYHMQSELLGSDIYPGGSTSHRIHQPSPGHTVWLLSPEPWSSKSTRVEGASIVMKSWPLLLPNRLWTDPVPKL